MLSAFRIKLRFATQFQKTIVQKGMLDKLKNKWNVNGIQLLLILCTFAIGGSLCGYVGRQVMGLLPLDKNVLWYVLYILIVTILWPFSVLLISIFFGQFKFFKNYLARVGRKMKIIK